jgi:hypothetical protein
MEQAARHGIKPVDRVLVVRIATQTMQFYDRGELVRSYVVSTSRRAPSNVQGSLGTPPGLHAIAEKIGAGTPPGIVFKGRVSTGFHWTELADSAREENLITTRILWLRGLEPGINQGGAVDSYRRYIYIHGTNRQEQIGTPLSAGCVLMREVELIELFERVRVNDWVWIVAEGGAPAAI